MEYSVGLLEGVDLGSVLDDELVDVELPLAALVVHVPEGNTRMKLRVRLAYREHLSLDGNKGPTHLSVFYFQKI